MEWASERLSVGLSACLGVPLAERGVPSPFGLRRRLYRRKCYTKMTLHKNEDNDNDDDDSDDDGDDDDIPGHPSVW